MKDLAKVQVGTRLQSTIKKERAVVRMDSLYSDEKSISRGHSDPLQAGKSIMPDNIVSLVNKRLTYIKIYISVPAAIGAVCEAHTSCYIPFII